jgi:hypothetical protein
MAVVTVKGGGHEPESRVGAAVGFHCYQKTDRREYSRNS